MTLECLQDTKIITTQNKKGKYKNFMVELKSKYKIIAFALLIQFYIQDDFNCKLQF